MRATWRSRLVLWLLRRVLRWERSTLSVEFGWNDPSSGDKPIMAVVTRIVATRTVLSVVYMQPAEARKLCQTGVEELDKQLEQWQVHWRTQRGAKP